MAVKRQHYVPQVYLKNWETTVSSKTEPTKPIKGVYYFLKDDLEIGDCRNKDSILWRSRLYTINYDISFIIPWCPIIQKDYIKQIEGKLKDRGVYAYLEGKKLKTRKELTQNFLKIDEWEFRYKAYPFNLAKRNAILNDLKQTNSYVLEHALDDVVEKKWNKSLEEFIYQMENTVPLNEIDEIRQIDESAVFEIVKMVIFLICRNPEFNYLGILPWIKGLISGSLPGSENEEDERVKEQFIKNQMDAVWLRELYKGLFDESSGYFHTIKETAKSCFQIMLYKCHENQGAFITSDKPAFEHISLLETPNLNSIFCPLTPQYLIMLMKGDDYSLDNVNFRLADNDLIKRLNRIILNNANNVIISNYKHLGYLL